jgi:HK97 family phage portal protein
MTSAGVRVNATAALSLPSYFAAIRAISEDIGKLPLKVYRKLAQGKETLPNHPVYRLLHDQPNRDMTAITFRSVITQHALGWGNGFAEIVRYGDGTPAELILLTPDRVTIERNVATGELRYRVQNESGGGHNYLRPDQMLHVFGLGYDGTSGYSIAHIARETIGLGLSSEKTASASMASGGMQRGVLESEKTLDAEAHKNLRRSWETTYSGPENAAKVVILEQGLKYTGISVPAKDAAFLESREFSAVDIARFFRIPPPKIQDLGRATWANLEQLQLEYTVDCLQPWAIRWEQEIDRKLFFDSERDVFAEHVFDGLLRGDTGARGEFYNKLFSVGAIGPDEIRDKENMNPVKDGDKHYVPMNMKPLGEEPEPEPRGEEDGSTEAEAEAPQIAGEPG